MEGDYRVVETLQTLEEMVGKSKLQLNLVMQSRELENGKTTRPYPIFHFKLNDRNIYLHVDVAFKLHDMLTILRMPATEAREKFEKQREEANRAREAREAKSAGSGNGGARATGKTDRDRAKPTYKTPEQKKREKSERDKAIRDKAQGRK